MYVLKIILEDPFSVILLKLKYFMVFTRVIQDQERLTIKDLSVFSAFGPVQGWLQHWQCLPFLSHPLSSLPTPALSLRGRSYTHIPRN